MIYFFKNNNNDVSLLPIAFAIITLFLFMFVGWFVFNSVSNSLSDISTEELNEIQDSYTSFFPGIIFAMLFMPVISIILLSLLVGSGDDVVSDDVIVSSDDEIISDNSEGFVDPVLVLKGRFARGEISCEEYTERMSRL